MRKKVAIYVRVSTDDQARTGYGLSDQERRCRQYIELYHEERLCDVELYRDDGYSAKNFNRPEVKRLIKEIKEDLIDLVIVFKLDRLTRSVVDVYSFITMVLDKECSLIAVLDHLDIRSANGRMFVGLLSCLSQWEREVISERTVAGLVEMVEQGKYPCGGTRPYGWNITETHYLTVNDEEANIMHYVADLFLDGYSIMRIRQLLKDEKNCDFSWNKIKRILSRTENIGEFNYRNKLYTNIFPPIFDKTKYDKVMKLLSQNQVTQENVYNYSFHRLVYCDCGERMEQTSTNRNTQYGVKIYYYYYCPKCKKRYSQLELERKLLGKAKFLIQKEFDENKEEVLHRKLTRINNKKNELFNEYMNHSLDAKAYSFSMTKFQKKENEVFDELESIKKTSCAIQLLTKEQKYEIIHTAIQKVVVDLKKQKVIDVIYKILINDK